MILIVTLNPCIDKTIYIEKNKLGRIIRAHKVKIIAGGKGNNVARVLKNLGVENISLNFLGGYYGKIIEECLKKDGIDYKPVWIKGSSRTVVTVLENNLRQTAFVEPGPEVSDTEKNNMISLFKKVIKEKKDDIKMVILSGSIPSINCIDMYKVMIETAKKDNIRTILDSRGEALKAGIEAKPFLVKPNIQELGDMLDMKLLNGDFYDKDKLVSCALKLESFADFIVLTMGSKGSILRYGKKIYWAIPPKIKVINPVGSGDSFTAGFAYGLYKEHSILDCIKIATAAGAANASTWDAASCTREEIMKFIDKVKVEK